MSGQPDIADILYDLRMSPPEPEDYTWQPEPGEELAYYEAGEGAECPVCHHDKPHHGRSCWIAGDYGPSYRLTPADFHPGGRNFDKENF